jgi:hypothetical protein
MIDPLLKQQLLKVFRRQRTLKLAITLAVCWGALAIVGLILVRLEPHRLQPLALWRWLFVGAATVTAGIAIIRNRRAQPDWHQIARRIEIQYPELNGLLLTAAQQQPATNGQLNYLQERVVREALRHAEANPWTATIPLSRVAVAQITHLLALLFLVCVLAGLRSPENHKGIFAGGWTADGVTITPGDTSIERGERLVVVASFDGSVPATVELVTSSSSAAAVRTPLVKSLSDPVFGGSIPEVATDLLYRVEYAGKCTRDFTVKVFEFPRLERADADLTFPEYTGLAPKRIENTHRVSAVEGSRCALTLYLNKPVTSGYFVVKGDSTNIIPLKVGSNSPIATIESLPFETNRTYLLQLVDADGRTNKVPAQVVVDVLRNRQPELKIASPRGDTRPSALEEMSFEGTVWDDFGVQSYGLAYTEAGGETKFIELGRQVPGNEKRAFKYLLRLEDLGAKPDQLFTWFLWADDVGPDGKIRRTAGDMYFAEVRPFDEVFRQGQGAGGDQQAGGQSGGAGGRQRQLAELQKQIINATWKLQRQTKTPNSKLQTPETLQKPNSKNERRSLRQAGSTAESTSFDPMFSVDEGFSRPFGTMGDGESLPNLEKLGYSQTIPPGWEVPMARVAFGQSEPTESGRPAAPETPMTRTGEQLSKVSSTNKTASASQFLDDLNVVRDAVADGISQAEAARDGQSGARNSALWDDLLREMQKAQAALEKAVQSPPSLSDALAAEQAAFQVLLKLQQREYEIRRNRSRSQSGQSNRDRQMQRELEQLDLTQPENRYENERLAQSPQTAERREQLQIMNRLAELARRQQDLNERLKELQTSLQEARTEEEREQIRRQLKRLQEEEQRMLADMDDLQQRMNQPENQSRMSEQRQQLDQTRQEMQRAAEAAQQGSPSQALASGTRAQRQLQQMRENMRKQNSSQFAEDLKQLRGDARDAERKQQEIRKQMDSFSGGDQKTLDDSQERQKALEQLTQQGQRLTNLVERATQLSQQTEEAEPLVSRELYDSVRKFSQDDAGSVRQAEDELIQHGLVRSELYQRLSRVEKEGGAKALELSSEMLQQGLLPQARRAGDRAGSEVRDLKQGIERAAEKVLGDDTEALRTAQQQLDQLTQQLEHEVTQEQGAAMTNRQTQANAAEPQTSQSEQRAQQPQAGRPQAETGNQNQTARPQGEAQQPNGGENQQNSQNAARNGRTSASNQRNNRSLRDGETPRGGDNVRVPSELDRFLNEGRGGNGNGNRWVITGEDYLPWSDRLREVEEIVDDTRWQNQLATARERARLLRQEYKRTFEKPEWAQVRLDVIKPLVEVRNQIADELARRGSQQDLVPVDRDPVPNRFSELVRRYYEELGKEK